jgi:hypothetical protein
MDLLLTLGTFVGLVFVSSIWGVDSRPGFRDGRFGRAERWFPHSKTD